MMVVMSAVAVQGGTDWPVFFEHLGRVHSIHNKWDLTFAVKTNFRHFEQKLQNISRQIQVFKPDLEEEAAEIEFAEDTDGSERTEEDKVFRLVTEHWEGLADLLQRRSDQLLRRLADYRSLGDNRVAGRSGDMRGEARAEEGDSLSRGQERLSWAQPRMLWGQAEVTGEDASLLLSRGKRDTDCRPVAGLASFLFGFTYQRNVECVSKQLEELKGTVRNDVSNMVDSQQKFSSRTQRELGETKSMVKKVEGMTKKMEKKVLVMERSSGGARSQSTVVMQQLDTEVRECDQFLDEMERVVASLASGRLSQALVPGPVLRRHLEGVEQGLPDNFTLLYPSAESLWPYYSVLSTSIYFSKDFEEMFVHLSIPLCDRSNDLNLYRVHNLPLKVRDGYSVTADLDTEYLLTAKEGKYHLELSKEDFQDCQVYQQGGQQFFCGFGPLLRSNKAASCVIQLFNVDGEGAMCQSRLTHGLVQPFTRLYNGSWVFAALSAQVPVEMHCPQSTIPTSLLGFGVINLMEGCTLSSTDFHYPHTFTSFTDVELSFNLDVADEKKEDSEGYEELPSLPQFHYDSDEPLVIAAIEAEIEDYSEDTTDEYFTDDVTTKVSVETSVEVISSIPDEDTVIENLKAALVTKDDFMEKATESDMNDELKTKTELKVLGQSSSTDTKLHQEVLVKLRDKIKNGKHWLDDFTSAVREIRKSI